MVVMSVGEGIRTKHEQQAEIGPELKLESRKEFWKPWGLHGVSQPGGLKNGLPQDHPHSDTSFQTHLTFDNTLEGLGPH
jgi:hypothetical protein